MSLSPMKARRRHNLQRLVVEAGGLADLERLSGTPSTHLSAMLAGRRGMGDRLAAKLESATGKPAGWLDNEIDGQEPPAWSAQQVMDALAELLLKAEPSRRAAAAAWLQTMAIAPDSRIARAAIVAELTANPN